MGGLIHPIGPEDKQTYWLRRAVVLVVLVALIVMVAVVIGNIRSAQASGEAAAEPANQPVQQNPGPDEAAEQPQPTPEAQTSQAQAPAPTPAAPTQPPAEQPQAQPNPVRTVETKQTAEPTQAPQPAQPTQPAQQPQPQPVPVQPQAQQAPAQPAEPATCDPKKMRVTLNGPKQVSPGVPATFKLSLINGTGADCMATVTKDNFELKIYSGTDRVWTSLDCLVGLHDQRTVLQPEKTLEWDLEWGANRSVSQCKVHPDTLRPGTYVATAQLKDAAPVQNVLQVR